MDDPATPVAGCALVYHESGWNPLELPVHAKGPPPEGRTGYEGRDMTPDEIVLASWTGNIGLRMPFDVIGLDVDAYRGGLDSLRALEQRLGPLPATWISHSGRNDQSGIRFYRVPRVGAWVTNLPGIDIIQRGHRYAAVWPSTHPDGRTYGWWDQTIIGPAERVPRVEDLPELPWPWTEELSRDGENSRTRAVDFGRATEFVRCHDGGEAPGYITVIARHFMEQTDNGGSRHDNMQHCLTWAMEEAAAGVVAAPKAVETLSALWVASVAPDTRRAELFADRRTTEFDAMLRHAIGKAVAKTQAELHELHDNVVGIPVRGATVGVGPDSPLSPGAPAPPDDMLELDDWAEATEAEDELVEGLIIGGRWTQFVAPAKQGKSSFELFVAIELSQGRHPFDGTPQPPIPVLYCDGEMGRRDLHELIVACGHDPAKLPGFYTSTTPVRLDDLKGAMRLVRRVDDLRAKLVVLDGLNGFVNPEASENDNNTWQPFYERAIQPLKRRGVAVISGDNMGKDASKGTRGWSGKNDKADAVIPIKRADKGIKLRPSFRRGGSFIEELNLEAEGFDRTRPIRYWRTAASWPPGTKEAAKVLDWLNVPIEDSRPKVRVALQWAIAVAEANNDDTEPFRIRNETLSGALRWRRQPVKVGTGSGPGRNVRIGANDGDKPSRLSETPADLPGQAAGTGGTD